MDILSTGIKHVGDVGHANNSGFQLAISMASEPWIGGDSDNLTGLTELNEKSLLKAIRKRYDSSLVYTDVGDILVAVNPLRPLQIYGEEWSQAYSRADVSALGPHAYRVAARAFNAMVNSRRDQVCVISGESGAGKTESSKFIMRQVMRICRSAGLGVKLQERIIQLNPVLEAFGNASTALNDNSSRFGKYIQLVFQHDGRIVGAGLEQYLLEKSRVCVQGDNERNFHIFYYMYGGLSSEMTKQLLLKSPSEHRYLRSYSKVEVDCFSDESRLAFNNVLQSMEAIGFKEEEIQQVLTVLAAIIRLGDIEFTGVDGDQDGAQVVGRVEAEVVAQLLRLESVEELCLALTVLRTTTRGETVDKLYSCSKAADVRDAVAKALYARLFQWIVARLNGYLQPGYSPDQLHLGILDIFGFENFEHNSLEQFCINLANEQLQQYFNHQIFAMEKVEYTKEGLEGLDISFHDNTPVLDLFLSRPIGLLSLLDEQCRGLNGTEKAYVQRCRESFGKHPDYIPNKGNAPVFTVKHYAGNVKYAVEGFLEKNKDSLPEAVSAAMKLSEVRLVRVLFTRFPTFSNSVLRRTSMNKSQRKVMRAMSRRKKSVRKLKPGAKKISTVTAHFRLSLELLMERVFSASPHFVRCIKPNLEKKPNKFDNDYVLKQLRYTGMLEAVRVRREGFAYRPFFSDFFHTFGPLAYNFTNKTVKASASACTFILEKTGLTGWSLGKSRVFLRYYHEDQLQMMTKEMEDKATLVQKTYRGYATRKIVRPLQERQREEKTIVTDFLSAMNNHGAECFPLLLAINKVDILQAVERFGNQRAQESVENSDLSESERKKIRAKKVGIMVPLFGGALSGGSAAVAQRRPTEMMKGSDSRASSNSSDSAHTTVPSSPGSPRRILSHLPSCGDLPDTPLQTETGLSALPQNCSDELSNEMVSQEPVPVDEPPAALEPLDNVHEHLVKQRPARHLVGGVKLLPPVQPFPQQSKNPPPVATKPTPVPRKSPEKKEGSSTHSTPPTVYPKPSPRRRPRKHEIESHSQEETAEAIPALRSTNSENRLSPVSSPAKTPPKPAPRSPKILSSTHQPASVSQIDPQSESQSQSQSQSQPPSQSQSQSQPQSQSQSQSQPQSQSQSKSQPQSQSQSQLPAVTVPPANELLSAEWEEESTLDFGGVRIAMPLNSQRQNAIAPVQLSQGCPQDTEVHLLRKGVGNRRSQELASESPSSPRSPVSPQVPFLKSEKKGGIFHFGRHKAVRKNVNSSTKDDTPSEACRSELLGKDAGTLGLYPDLRHQTAVDLVLGQPRGTYVIHKEDYKTHSKRGSSSASLPVYTLVVAVGIRQPASFKVLCSQGTAGNLYLYIDKSSDGQTFPDLTSLLEHYRRVEISSGIVLLYPRLVAGVTVSGTGAKVRRPPPRVRGKHKK